VARVSPNPGLLAVAVLTANAEANLKPRWLAGDRTAVAVPLGTAYQVGCLLISVGPVSVHQLQCLGCGALEVKRADLVWTTWVCIGLTGRARWRQIRIGDIEMALCLGPSI